jgi:hypothetical protein
MINHFRIGWTVSSRKGASSGGRSKLNEDVVVQAQRFEVVDRDGKVRAVIGMMTEQDKTVGVHLLRADGTKAVTLDLTNDLCFGKETELPALNLFDHDNTVRISLNISSESPQYPGIALTDSRGNERIGIVVTPDDDAEISIANPNRASTWVATESHDADLARMLSRLKLDLQHLYNNLGVIQPQLSDHIQNLINQGHKLEAIKLYREENGVSLLEAKDAIESLR